MVPRELDTRESGRPAPASPPRDEPPGPGGRAGPRTGKGVSFEARRLSGLGTRPRSRPSALQARRGGWAGGVGRLGRRGGAPETGGGPKAPGDGPERARRRGERTNFAEGPERNRLKLEISGLVFRGSRPAPPSADGLIGLSGSSPGPRGPGPPSRDDGLGQKFTGSPCQVVTFLKTTGPERKKVRQRKGHPSFLCAKKRALTSRFYERRF